MVSEYLDLQIALLESSLYLLWIPLVLVSQKVLLLLPHQRLTEIYYSLSYCQGGEKDIRGSEVGRLLADYPGLDVHAHVPEANLHLVRRPVLMAQLPRLLEALQSLLILGCQLPGALASLPGRTQLAPLQQKLLLLDDREADVAVFELAGKTVPLLLLYDRLDCL